MQIHEDAERAAMLEIMGDQHCGLMKILGEQQYWRYWESSNTGDTGRAALQINEDNGRSALLINEDIGRAPILGILGDKQCRLMKILGNRQCWRYWEISTAYC